MLVTEWAELEDDDEALATPTDVMAVARTTANRTTANRGIRTR
jgi:hypothetical protein